MALLSIGGLEAGYGGITVLRDVDIDVEAGAFVAVLGANGAGKSTLVRTILGIARRFKGVIRFDGEDISGLDTAARIRRGVGVIPEGRQLFGDMTVQENLALGQYVHRSFGRPPPVRDMERVLDLLPRLADRAFVLESGRVVTSGHGDELAADPRLRNAYLGGSNPRE